MTYENNKYAGFYSDIELTKPTGTVTDELERKRTRSRRRYKNPKESILYTQF